MLRFLAAALALCVALTAPPARDARAASGPATMEPALDAAAFVDSVGVNVHFSYQDGPYGKREAILRLLRELGVRHVRDGVTAGRTDLCETARTLASRGVRFTYITQPHPVRATLHAWAACAGDAVEAFEGVNEYDIAHPASEADWAATLRASQAELYAAVKGDPSLAHLTVIGPSLTSSAAASAVGDLSNVLDAGNTHDYFAGHEPETGGWGLGGYGSIAYNLNFARLNSGAKPIVATETGYATPPAPRSIAEPVQAAYVPRLFLAQAAAGIPRTFEYELVDEGEAPFGTLGLVRSDLTPKPAFRALASLLRELRSTHRLPAAQALPLTIDGAPADLRRMLFARDDGTYVLAVWRAGALWEPRFARPLEVDTATVSLHSGLLLKSARVVAIQPDGELAPEAGLVRPAALRLRVGPRVTFVEMRPGGAS